MFQISRTTFVSWPPLRWSHSHASWVKICRRQSLKPGSRGAWCFSLGWMWNIFWLIVCSLDQSGCVSGKSHSTCVSLLVPIKSWHLRRAKMILGIVPFPKGISVTTFGILFNWLNHTRQRPAHEKGDQQNVLGSSLEPESKPLRTPKNILRR